MSSISPRFVPFGMACLFALPLPAQVPLNFSVLAGSPASADPDDGTGTAARFASPTGIAIDAAGNIFVADTANHAIRRVTGAGVVTTFAGLSVAPGNVDGPGGLARFNQPVGLEFDGSGNLYVSEWGNHTIRRITTAGVVSTVAGVAGTAGNANGAALASTFNQPVGMAFDSLGALYIADLGNHLIRKLAAGAVTTFAGQGVCGTAEGTGAAAAFCNPSDIAINGATGELFVTDYANQTIRKLTSGATSSLFAGQAGVCGSGNGFGALASFCGPWSLARDGSGTLYVADETNHIVRMVTAAGGVSTPAGTPGVIGSADGAGAAAQFYIPEGIALDPVAGGLVLSDFSNNDLRRITLPGAVVTRLAGTPVSAGSANGTGTAAQFQYPRGIGRDGAFIYVADSGNHMIRKIAAGGVVTLMAGSGTAGFADGAGAAAQFNAPFGVAADGFGNAFVADSNNRKIRAITAGGVVSTWAGPDAATCAGNGNNCPGGSADGNGTAARFRGLRALASDGMGNLYVADFRNHNIRKIDSFRNVTTFAGPDTALCTGAAPNFCPSGTLDATGTAARFSGPQGVAVDSAGNVYVADTLNHTIRRITPAGVVTTLAGSAGKTGSVDGIGSNARFRLPGNLWIDASGDLLIADRGNSTIRKMTPSGIVTTVAGRALQVGSGAGTGPFARFFNPWGVITDAAGNVIVADTGNHALRISAATGLNDVATIDQPVGGAGVLRQLGTNPDSSTTWAWKLVRWPTGGSAELSSAVIRNPDFTPDLQDYYVFRVTAANGANSATSEVSLRTAVNPRITRMDNGSPAHAQANGVMFLTTEDAPGPVTLLFSDGVNPTVAPLAMGYDAGRGLLLAMTPAGAADGMMQLTAGGTAAPPYYFKRDAGSVSLGSSTISGTVTRQSDGTPVAGAAVILMVPGTSCSEQDGVMWNFGITDASGNYSVIGQAGVTYDLYVLAPLGAGLANSGTQATAPATGANVALEAGTRVTGRVIDAVTQAPLPRARVDMNGPGFEFVLTDELGNFSMQLPPGDYEYRVHPSPGSAVSRLDGNVTIGAASPQNLGDIALQGGVRISGTVTRATGGAPASSTEVNAWPNMGGNGLDETYALGDGSYSVIVPANSQVTLNFRTDGASGLAEARQSITVGTAPLVLNASLPDAAYVTGTVRDRANSAPLGGMSVNAARVSDGQQISWTETCPDGTYRLVVPAGGSHRIITQNSSCSQCTPPPPPVRYANQAWNGTANGTFFTCEGTPVTVATPGATQAGINFDLVQAAVIQGSLFTQASGCTVTNPSITNPFIQVDNGVQHVCSLGNSDWNNPPPAGQYRVIDLPPSALVGSIRVCYPFPPSSAPQCYNLKRADQTHTPVVVASGATATANFCLGNTPTTQTGGLQVSKSGMDLLFSWSPSSDLYQTQYTLWGGQSAIPVPPPGSFPNNPSFINLFMTVSTSAQINPTTSNFFLVTATGPTGNHGPSGSYGN